MLPRNLLYCDETIAYGRIDILGWLIELGLSVALSAGRFTFHSRRPSVSKSGRKSYKGSHELLIPYKRASSQSSFLFIPFQSGRMGRETGSIVSPLRISRTLDCSVPFQNSY